MDTINWVTVIACILLAICGVRLFCQSIEREVERRVNLMNMLRQQASILYRNRNITLSEISNNAQDETIVEETMVEETDVVIFVQPNATVISLGIKCEK